MQIPYYSTIFTALYATFCRNSPYTVSVQDGQYPTNPAKCTARGKALAGASAGEETEFSVQLVNSEGFGQPARNNNEQVTVEVSALGLSPGDVVPAITFATVNSPVAVVKLTPTLKGAYSLVVKVDGTAIAGSPFGITVKSGLAAAPKSYLLETGAAPTAGASLQIFHTAGNETKLTMIPADKMGNCEDYGTDLSSSRLQVTLVASSGSTAVSTASLTTALTRLGTNARYVVTYKGTISGVFSLSLVLYSKHISGSPFTLTVSPGNALPNRFTLTDYAANEAGKLVMEAGVASTFSLTARDTYANIVPTSSITLTKTLTSTLGSLSDGSLLGVECSTFGGGVTANVDCCKAEALRLASRYRSPACYGATLRLAYGLHCGGSGGTAHLCQAACDTLNATCSDGLGSCAAISRRAGSLTLDAASDCFAGTAAAVGAVAGSPTGLTHTITDPLASSGVFSVTLRGTVAASYQLAVRMGSAHVTGSPFQLVVAAAALDASKVWVHGPALTVAQAGARAKFDVRMRDQHLNHIIGSVTDVSGSLSGPRYLQLVSVDNKDGSYSVSYLANRVGTYTMLLILSASTITQTYTVVVKPGPLDAAQCDVSGQTSTAVAGITSKLSIATRDSWYNGRISGGDSLVATLSRLMAGGGYTAPTSLVVTDSADGKFASTYYVETSGSYKIVLSLVKSGIHTPIGTSPYSLTVKPAATAGGKFTGLAVQKVVAGVPASCMIVATDRFGNDAVFDPFTVDLGFGVTFLGSGSRIVNATATSTLVVDSTWQDEVFQAPSSVTNNLDNTYSIGFTLTAATHHVIMAEYPLGSGLYTTDSPAGFRVSPSITYGPYCVVQQQNLGFVAGMNQSFYIRAKDRFRNVVLEVKKASIVLATVRPPQPTRIFVTLNSWDWGCSGLTN